MRLLSTDASPVALTTAASAQTPGMTEWVCEKEKAAPPRRPTHHAEGNEAMGGLVERDPDLQVFSNLRPRSIGGNPSPPGAIF